MTKQQLPSWVRKDIVNMLERNREATEIRRNYAQCNEEIIACNPEINPSPNPLPTQVKCFNGSKNKNQQGGNQTL